jgi:hypothetical protein
MAMFRRRRHNRYVRDPQAELNEELQALGGLEKRVYAGTEGESRVAGTYADTPEFRQGLASEQQARARGARMEALRRINERQRALGLPITQGVDEPTA